MVALVLLVFQTTSAVILTRYSKIEVDAEPYYSTTVVVMAELTKFVFSLLLIFFVDTTASISTERPPSIEDRYNVWKKMIVAENFMNPLGTLNLAIPAMLYTLQNNLIYVALNNLEATTFQVGYQMKVITTAVLSVLMLHRHLSVKKWIALFMLTFGIVCTQLDSSGSKKVDSAKHEQSFVIGITSVITCGCCSAFAGVYFEKILKGSNPSVWMRNAQLAFFSLIIGLAGVAYNDGFDIRFFQGYNLVVWSIVLVQAGGGLIIAVVVKYADNILKGFATAVSIILCGVTSSILFGFVPTMTFVFGSVVVIVATFLYSAPDAPAAPPGGVVLATVAAGGSPITVTPLGLPRAVPL